MKRMAVVCGALAALMFSVGAFAGGYHQKGFVYVGSTYMYGSMNVRYNTDATSYEPFIYATGIANGTVSFIGRGSDGNMFSCYLQPTSPLYAAAVDIKNSFGNGGYLYVTKGTNSNDCTSIQNVAGSYLLD